MFKNYVILLVMFVGVSVSAQNVDFGVQAGYVNMEEKASNSFDDISLSDNHSGFFIGFLTDLQLNDSWHLQPSVNYMNIEDNNFLSVPILAQYYISDSNFYVEAGPQATFLLEDNVYLSTFGLDLAFGAGYSINENFFIEAKYGIELTNRVSQDIIDAAGSVDVDASLNTLTMGVGYKF